MSSKDRRIAKLEIKDVSYYWIECLREDEEFNKDVDLIRSEVHKYFPKDKSFFNYDDDVLESVNIPIKVRQMIPRISVKYHLNITWFRRYLNGHFSVLSNPLQASAKSEKGWITLRIDSRVTQQNFRDLWPMVKAVKSELIGSENVNSRNRITPNYKLIYCIGRALDKGMTIKDIYKLYDDGNLSGYNHSTADKNYTLKEFQDFYRMYKFYG